VLQVTETDGPRFELALERLRAGHGFALNDVSFCLVDKNLLVNVKTAWLIENLTEQRAMDELARGQKVYETLLKDSPAFSTVVENLEPSFVLISDYGNGTVELARLINERLVWAKGFTSVAVE